MADQTATTLLDIIRHPAVEPSHPALRDRRGGRDLQIDYAGLRESAEAIARGLIATGVRPGDKVSILATTRPEWTLADFGTLCAGAVVVPIYATDSPEECAYVLNHSGARVVFCENDEQLAKVRQIRDRCLALEAVVAFEDAAEGEISLEQLRERGTGSDAAQLDRIAEQLTPEDPATIIYTSGTTGPPKGCVTTHANLLQTARMYERQIDVGPDCVLFLFLPLAHSLARLVPVVGLDVGATIAYWGGDPDRIIDDLHVAHPTHVPVVPRVLEKVHTRVLGQMEAGGAARRTAAARALRTGRRRSERVRQGRSVGPLLSLEHRLADGMVLSKVRGLFGPELRLVLTGAAPVARDILTFFDACGVLVLEGYGLTESTAAGTLNTPGRVRFGTVGPALPGAEVMIAADGEILLRGANVFSGYLGDEGATAETLTPDGWLRTGDLGTIDEAGFLQVTGRKKEIIITAGGKNITPALIETALREIRWVSDAVVFGDRRPYLVALITLDPEQAPALAGELGIAPDPAAMATDPRVHAALAREIEQVNRRFARVEQVKRFAIIEREFAQDSGELTPTMKVKRRIVDAEFAEMIERLYA